MKILIGYPPISNKKGTPLLSQNRQFQYFNNPTYIFPIIPAYAATLLKSNNYEVIWKDAIAENINKKEFFDYLKKESPDLFMFETKTPVIQEHWKIINEIKERFPNIKIAVCGDHVTALPLESFKKSKVDYVITGGDFDFSLLELCNHLTKKLKLPKGIYHKEKNKIKNTGKFDLNHNLNDLSFIDRDLTKWHLYQKEYNMKYKPFMYIMSGRDCPYGNCTFCSWPTLFPKFRTRSVENVLDEIGMLIKKYNVKEIFNDVGTHPSGKWLRDFCKGMIKRGYNKKIVYSTNFRFDYINLEDAKLMKKAGFRLLKLGLESGSQRILDKINKSVTIKQIKFGCYILKKVGLEVHLTVMYGHFSESKKEALQTYRLTKELMKRGLADVLQSTIIIPYPSTKMYKEALKNKAFLIDPTDWDSFDMSKPILKTLDMSPKEIQEFCDKTYKLFLSPRYIIKTLLKNWNNPHYLWNGFNAVINHVKDFRVNKNV